MAMTVNVVSCGCVFVVDDDGRSRLRVTCAECCADRGRGD